MNDDGRCLRCGAQLETDDIWTSFCPACDVIMCADARLMEKAARQRKRYGWGDEPDQGKAWVVAMFYEGKLHSLSPRAIRAKGRDWWLAIDGIGKVTLARIERLAGGWE